MSEPKSYQSVLAEAAKRQGLAATALALSITALATTGDAPSQPEASAPTLPAERAEVAALAPSARTSGKRLEVSTDVDVSPGARITATGKVDTGARALVIDSCVGHYDEATRICVLSPGPWELHSACYERAGSDSQETVCEVIVRNTGSVPLKFSGYVEVAAP